MNNFFKVIDNLPVVRILQIMAVFLFVGHAIMYFSYYFKSEMFYGDPVDQLLGQVGLYIKSTLMLLSQSSFHPLVLLGLAEIIKILKVQGNDKN